METYRLRVRADSTVRYAVPVAGDVGLRQRKKERTRRVLHETAVRLFLERGFDEVTVAEIADEADTAVTTLFTYFPGGKVALVFDQDEDRAAALTQAIRDRDAGVDVLATVEVFMADRLPFDEDDATVSPVLTLVASTAALRDHARRKWTGCEDALTSALEEQLHPVAGTQLRALARLVLECPDIASRETKPRAALSTILANLRRGWQL